MPRPRSCYDTLFTRLAANTKEPENGQACWVWVRRRCRFWYGKTTLYVPGLRKTVSLYAHVLMYCVFESNAKTGDDAYLAYQELRASGLELDHLCNNPSCIYPDHLDPVTQLENTRRRGLRSHA